MLNSHNNTKILVQTDDLKKISLKRIKSFRKACYKKDRFWCCEFRCEREFRTEQDKKEFEIYKKNMDTINSVFSKKSS